MMAAFAIRLIRSSSSLLFAACILFCQGAPAAWAKVRFKSARLATEQPTGVPGIPSNDLASNAI